MFGFQVWEQKATVREMRHWSKLVGHRPVEDGCELDHLLQSRVWSNPQPERSGTERAHLLRFSVIEVLHLEEPSINYDLFRTGGKTLSYLP